MEVVIDLLNLSEILVLHTATSFAFGAVLVGVREENLVNDNVVDVDLLLGQFDRQSLCLVHAEEFGDADSYECCLASIFELLVHILNL